MQEVKEIHYEPHPVSPERKKELMRQGLCIVDAIYDPEFDPKKVAKARTPKQEKSEE